MTSIHTLSLSDVVEDLHVKVINVIKDLPDDIDYGVATVCNFTGSISLVYDKKMAAKVAAGRVLKISGMVTSTEEGVLELTVSDYNLDNNATKIIDTLLASSQIF